KPRPQHRAAADAASVELRKRPRSDLSPARSVGRHLSESFPIMTSLAHSLSGIVGHAFAAEGLDAAYGKVTVSNRPDLAQFQCNGALAAAKAAKQPPRAIAEKVAARLKDDPTFREVTLAGPGLINLNVTDAFLAERMNRLRGDGRLGLAPTA